MEKLGESLRKRAQELGLTDTDVAHRAGLAPRRYGFYATGDRQPDYQTFIAICKALDTTPNFLLGFDEQRPQPSSRRGKLEARLSATGNLLSDPGFKLVADHAELVLSYEQK